MNSVAYSAELASAARSCASANGGYDVDKGITSEVAVEAPSCERELNYAAR